MARRDTAIGARLLQGAHLDTNTGTQPSGCRVVSIAPCCSVNAAFLFAEPRLVVVVSSPCGLSTSARFVAADVRRRILARKTIPPHGRSYSMNGNMGTRALDNGGTRAAL